jgi:hypothetical protein
MRKRLIYLGLFAVFGALALSTRASAAGSANAYLVVRCTATISVELFSRAAGGGLPAKTTYYNFGDVAAASTATSVNPIGVRNNSQGAITRWELDVLEPASPYIDATTHWTLGSTPGLNRAALYAKFSSSTLTSADFNIVNDTVTSTSQGAKTYSAGSFYSQCSQYIVPLFSTDASLVVPTSYDSSAEGKAERQLWLKLLTPTAVESANIESNIILRVTAK